MLLTACQSVTPRTWPASPASPGSESPPVLPDMSVDAPVSPLTPPPSTPSLLMPSLGDEIAVRALALLGKPYRYGGADLDGFDCSGLVFFIHQELGFDVPRTAAEQQRRAMRVDRTQLEPGDLLFFRTLRGKRISHVGIYVGEHRFVHAPQSGKPIELRDMDDDYYRKRLVSAGRLYPLS